MKPASNFFAYFTRLIAVSGMLVGCSTNTDSTQAQNRQFNGTQRAVHDKLPLLTIQQVIDDANQSFMYRGRPIHPALIHKFEPLLSDINPITVVVDIAAAFDSNECSQPVTQNEKLGLQCEMSAEAEGTHKESYAYKPLGVLHGNVHVLKTASIGSGTGIFMSLIFVRFEIGQAIASDGQPYDQLLLRLLRSVSLGDRFNGSVDVLNDEVVVKTDKEVLRLGIGNVH